ncbi:antibiotic biosynthesis monooxygenase [Stenomitos frigidus]|uniref:Antibiotic biosynthesis monooxygenase n=1 Tax=Stenomitos frigidus ULC18 TaxID=2107698 RepID=A0A2T1EPN9_9CYAN|nr:antibiotic biosynthesis monooxygenase [Stenomitos frigidus]PSB34694.1 antibiotic biosynthesis monooxygenase [Stenomitos frigidus ULC18]
MNQTQEHSAPITLVISEIVDPNHIQEYEAWTQGMNQAASQFEGFLGVETIRPRDHTHPEYVVILKFKDYSHFRRWQLSATFQEWIDRERGLVVRRSRQYQPSGMELWFTLPEHGLEETSQPAYYKKVILGVLAVYPLILLANMLLGPVLKGLPSLLGLLLSVTFVSALLTYPIMPWLTKLLSFWLYPSSRQRHQKR